MRLSVFQNVRKEPELHRVNGGREEADCAFHPIPCRLDNGLDSGEHHHLIALPYPVGVVDVGEVGEGLGKFVFPVDAHKANQLALGIT